VPHILSAVASSMLLALVYLLNTEVGIA